jgi:hypothetical protein|tara:strand:- start:4982 stop:5224 length:243 start_codon:yes stop_codon:yes gene_type:complete
MQIVNGNFNKQEATKTLEQKLTEAYAELKNRTTESQNGSYILLADIDSEIFMSSDLRVEDFNFMLDIVKAAVVNSAVFTE